MHGNFVTKKVRVSSNDALAGYLEDKIKVDEDSLQVEVVNEGETEYLQLALRNSGSQRIGETYSWVQQSYDSLETNSADYLVKARFVYAGSTRMGVPQRVLLSVKQEPLGPGSIRLWDATHNNSLAEVQVTSSVNFVILDMGELTNISEEASIIEVHMKTDAGKLHLSSLIFLY